MTHTNWWAQPTAKVSKQIQTQAQERQNQLTKPQGSLGRLENVAVQLAALQGQVKPQINQPYMLVFAADHGVVAQGVSAFPQSVTIAMLANFVEGRSEEHTSELQSRPHLVCRLLLEKKKKTN